MSKDKYFSDLGVSTYREKGWNSTTEETEQTQLDRIESSLKIIESRLCQLEGEVSVKVDGVEIGRIIEQEVTHRHRLKKRI